MQLESPKRPKSESSSVMSLPALKEGGSISLPTLPTDVNSISASEDTAIKEGAVDVSNEVNYSESIQENKSGCVDESISSVSILHGSDENVLEEFASEKSCSRDAVEAVQTDEERKLQQLSNQMHDFVLLLSPQVDQNEQARPSDYQEVVEDLESQLYSLQQIKISPSAESVSRHVTSLFDSISSFLGWFSAASQVDVALFPFFFHCILFVQTVLLSNSSVKLYGIRSNVLLEFSRNGSITP